MQNKNKKPTHKQKKANKNFYKVGNTLKITRRLKMKSSDSVQLLSFQKRK